MCTQTIGNLLYAPLAQTNYKDGKQLKHTHTHTKATHVCVYTVLLTYTRTQRLNMYNVHVYTVLVN